MSPEDKDLLKRSLALAEENNDMLRSIRRSQRLSSIMSLLYWVFIIGSLAGAYYLTQPYIDKIMSLYGSAKTNLDSAGGINAVVSGLKKLNGN